MDAIHLPVGLTLPSAFGAPTAPLQAGQVIQALVLELIESDIFRLQLPQATIDVRSSVPLTPGNTITLAVKGTGPSARLAIYTDVPPVSSAGRGLTPAPNLVGRTPIGEAVVIARAPAGQAPATSGQGAVVDGRNAAPPTRTVPEAASPREALPNTAPTAARQIEAPIRLVTPDQAVTEAIQTAAPRQAGLAPLFADITQVAQAAEDAPSPVPASVREAAADVLSLRVPLGEQLTAADVKQAFVRSGILFEPKLAAAATPPPSAPAPSLPEGEARPAQAGVTLDPAVTPTPRDDLKAALLVLRQVLRAWAPAEPGVPRPVSNSVGRPAPDPAQAQTPAPRGGAPLAQDVAAIRQIASALAGSPEELIPGRALPAAPLSADEATGLAKTLASALTARDTAPARQPPSPAAVPPPYRGAPLAAQAVAAPAIAPDAPPHESAGRLIAETDGALARTTLLQVASLPDQPVEPRAEATQRWNFEVPLATPQGTAIAQFEVSRDGRALRTDPQARTWRARFSLDVEPMGAVHAMIALTGARTSVTLWAERAATATRLGEHAPLLSEALRAADLEPVDFSARLGVPPVARQAVAGRFMDRAS
ncbi:MAG: flagellar hook-length control protein FliK [Alphaproteobacteria bacterium]